MEKLLLQDSSCLAVEYLQLVHTRRLMVRFDDSEAVHDQEIDQVTDEIGLLFQRTESCLKKLTNPFITTYVKASETDKHVRMNTQRALASRIQELSSRFRRMQQDYLRRLQFQKYGSDKFLIDEGDPTQDYEVHLLRSIAADMYEDSR